MKILFIVILFLISLQNTSAQTQTGFAIIGDYGTADINELNVANLVKSWNPEFIITLGDNSYGTRDIDTNIGQFYSDYIGNYTGSYGSGADTNRFFPSPGNHDWTDGEGMIAYLNYFTLPGDFIATGGTSGNERYYDFVIRDIHFFALSSYFLEPDGNTSTSIQAAWLQNALAASNSKWKIVFMHHPPYSSSTKSGSQVYMQWPYEYWGADLVLGGHDHTYERIMRDNNADGTTIPYIVNGTGGRTLYGFPTSGFVEGSVVRYNSNFGAMLVTTTELGLTLKYYSIDNNGTLQDSLTINKSSTDIQDNHTGNILPDNFVISQNYPNPFNPVTTIEFSIPYRTDVTLVIYNLLGQKVKTIMQAALAAGQHTFKWDSTDDSGQPVSSGIYLYRLTSADFTESKKMLLIK